jgi:hypothetical protein
VLARLTVMLTCVGLLFGSPALAEPPARPRDHFDPVPITAVERPVEPLPAPAVEPVPEPIVILPAPLVPEPPVRCVADRRCRGMRIAGITIGLIGLAAVGTGVGLVTRKDRVIAETPAFVTSTRPPGLVSLTIGVGVTLTAVLVLVASRSATRAPSSRAARLDRFGLRF